MLCIARFVRKYSMMIRKINAFNTVITKLSGPPDIVVDSKEQSREWLGIDTPCRIKSRESLSAIRRAVTLHCKTLIANISCQVCARKI